MMRRFTLASSTRTTLSASRATPSTSAFALRPMHTSGPLQYPTDQFSEELRTHRRERIQEDIRNGKLPEVNPEPEFRADSLVNKEKERLARASQEQPIQKEASDDFSDENNCISDAQMDPEKLLDVHDAPPLNKDSSNMGGFFSNKNDRQQKRNSTYAASQEMGETVQKRSYGTRNSKDSVVSDAVDGFGGVGSKIREKMNSAEHNQKFSTRGNLTPSQSSFGQEKELQSERSAVEAGAADLGKEKEPEWSSSASSLQSNWSDESDGERGELRQARARRDGDAVGESKLNKKPLPESASVEKEPEWSRASTSVNTSWSDGDSKIKQHNEMQDKKQNFSEQRGKADYLKEGNAEISGLDQRNPFNSKLTSDSSRESRMGQGINQPFPDAKQQRSYSTSAGKASDDKQSKDGKNQKEGSYDGSRPPSEMADFLGEKPMHKDDKGTQAKKNAAQFGEGWQNRIKDDGKDYSSSGASGAPAHNMREKPVNYKSSSSSSSSQKRGFASLAFRATTPLTHDFPVRAFGDFGGDLNQDVYLGWRVTNAQGGSTFSL